MRRKTKIVTDLFFKVRLVHQLNNEIDTNMNGGDSLGCHGQQVRGITLVVDEFGHGGIRDERLMEETTDLRLDLSKDASCCVVVTL